MTTPRNLLAALCCLGLAAALPAVALTAEQWREDLDRLVDHVREEHRSPYHSISEADFAAAVAALEADLPSLPERSVILRMARLVAAVGDGHTRLGLPLDSDHLGYRLAHRKDPDPAPSVPRFGLLPVRLRLLGDGVHVVAATAAHRGLLGARVERIAEVEAMKAVEKILPWIYGDTESGRRHSAALHLAVPALLAEAGITASAEEVPLILRHADGRVETVSLAALDYGEEASWHELGPEEPPLWLRDPASPFWLAPLAGEDALYVQLNQVQDEVPGETLGQFGARMARAIAEQSPEKVILDLRHNHGGDASLARAVVLPLVRWTGSAEYGRLYTLVGPETFSAAVDLLDRLEQWTQNILVGEGPGSGPTSYSDADRELLPNSRFALRVSTSYHIGWTGGEQRTAYELDLPVATSAAALAAGRDPVLDRALSHEVGDDLAARMIAAYDDGGINSALFVVYRTRTDPLTAELSTEGPMNALARHVLEVGPARFAAALYRRNWESYPDSAAAYRGEAEARLVMGDLEAAREAIENALRLAPEDPRSRELAGRIEAGGVE